MGKSAPKIVSLTDIDKYPLHSSFLVVPSAEWTELVRENYKKCIETSTDDSNDSEFTSIVDIIEWYRQRLSDYVLDKKEKDDFQGMMTRITNKFVQMVSVRLLLMSLVFISYLQSTNVYEDFGVHVFGFAINPDTDTHGRSNSSAWGGSPEYGTLRTVTLERSSCAQTSKSTDYVSYLAKTQVVRLPKSKVESGSFEFNDTSPPS